MISMANDYKLIDSLRWKNIEGETKFRILTQSTLFAFDLHTFSAKIRKQIPLRNNLNLSIQKLITEQRNFQRFVRWRNFHFKALQSTNLHISFCFFFLNLNGNFYVLRQKKKTQRNIRKLYLTMSRISNKQIDNFSSQTLANEIRLWK